MNNTIYVRVAVKDSANEYVWAPLATNRQKGIIIPDNGTTTVNEGVLSVKYDPETITVTENGGICVQPSIVEAVTNLDTYDNAYGRHLIISYRNANGTHGSKEFTIYPTPVLTKGEGENSVIKISSEEYPNTATGDDATSIGKGCDASGNSAFVTGQVNQGLHSGGITGGNNNLNAGAYALVIGQSNMNNPYYSPEVPETWRGSRAIVGGYNIINTGANAIVSGTGTGSVINNEGDNAIIAGNKLRNSGDNALVTGSGNVNYGDNVLIAGDGNYSNSNNGLVVGRINTVQSSLGSIVGGHGNTLRSTNYGAVVGQENTATANLVYIFGYKNNLESTQSSAIGSENKSEQVSASNVHLIGKGLLSKFTNQIIIGRYNSVNNEAIFIVGDGTSDADRKNSLEVLRNGNVRVYGTPQNDNDVVTKKYVDDSVSPKLDRRDDCYGSATFWPEQVYGIKEVNGQVMQTMYDLPNVEHYPWLVVQQPMTANGIQGGTICVFEPQLSNQVANKQYVDSRMSPIVQREQKQTATMESPEIYVHSYDPGDYRIYIKRVDVVGDYGLAVWRYEKLCTEQYVDDSIANQTTEEWTFTLEDNSTVTKRVVVK